MRVVFVGASTLSVTCARLLIEKGHEVVLIDEDEEVIEDLSEELDCGLIAGDGSRPAVLEEVGPQHTDVLFCLSNRDEANILSALVGRSIGFGRVVPKIEDADLESICTELGLSDVIVPDRGMATILVDLVEGRSNAALTTVVGGGLRFLAIEVPEGVKSCEGLELPASAATVARNREGQSVIAEASTSLEPGDEVVLIVAEDDVDAIRSRFAKPPSDAEAADESRKGS